MLETLACPRWVCSGSAQRLERLHQNPGSWAAQWFVPLLVVLGLSDQLLSSLQAATLAGRAE